MNADTIGTCLGYVIYSVSGLVIVAGIVGYSLMNWRGGKHK
jgi:hypothetical protein